MKLVVVTYGTEGDTRPLAALSRALMDSGHAVRLMGDRAVLGSAAMLGVPSTALSGDIRTALMPADARASQLDGDGGFKNTAKVLAAIANAQTAAWMREVADASEGCDAIVASGLAAFVALSVAEFRNVPAIGAGLIPITPTRSFPSPFLPPGRTPRWFNRASHGLVNGLLWQMFRKTTNAARASVCRLEPHRGGWNAHPMLYGISPNLLSQPADWSGKARACGQWAAADPAWTPPAALAAFLAAGDAPIYVGFGSMAGLDRPRLMEAVLAAVAGRRALFSPGWSGVDAASLPKNFFVVGETPHRWLFPRTAMVVHHGGSGTAHSAAAAGVPSVVVPFAGDQFFGADRLRQQGVAGRAVVGSRIDAAQLAGAMAFAERGDVRARSRDLAQRMAQEDGLARAVRAIERFAEDATFA